MTRAPFLLAALLTANAAHADTNDFVRNMASADYLVNTLCKGRLQMTPTAQKLVRQAQRQNHSLFDEQWAAEAKGPTTNDECLSDVWALYSREGYISEQIGTSIAIKLTPYKLKNYPADVQPDICADTGVCK